MTRLPDRRDRPRRRGDLPARRRHARCAGDRVIIFVESQRVHRGRAGAVTIVVRAAPHARRARSASTSAARSTSSARWSSTSSLAFLFPIAVALGYGEPFWPFLAAGAITAAGGRGLDQFTAARSAIGAREGFLVVALTWLCRRSRCSAAVPPLGRGRSSRCPSTPTSRRCPGSRPPGASVLTDIEALNRSMLPSGASFTHWLGGMGIIVLALAILPRLRVGGRQLLESEMPGPEIRAARARDPRHRAAALAPLRRPHRRALRRSCRLGWTGADRRDDAVPGVAHAFTTMPTAGFSTRRGSIESLRRRHPVGDHRLP